MIQTRALLLALLALAPAAHAADNARCMEVYNAELARITREAEAAARGRPAPRDLEAQRQILIPIERAMREAADKADKCERGNRDHSKDEATTMNIRARQCAEDVDRQLAMLRGRYKGNMPAQERETLRAQEAKLEAARADCIKLAS